MNATENTNKVHSADIQEKVGKTLVYGILSLVLAIFTFGIGSLIFSIITLKNVKRLSDSCPPEARKKLNTSKALGIMGLVLSILVMIAVVAAVILIIAAIILLGIKAIIEVIAAIIGIVLSILAPIIGIAMSAVMRQLFAAVIEWLMSAFSEAAILFIA